MSLAEGKKSFYFDFNFTWDYTSTVHWIQRSASSQVAMIKFALIGRSHDHQWISKAAGNIGFWWKPPICRSPCHACCESVHRRWGFPSPEPSLWESDLVIHGSSSTGPAQLQNHFVKTKSGAHSLTYLSLLSAWFFSPMCSCLFHYFFFSLFPFFSPGQFMCSLASPHSSPPPHRVLGIC